MGFRRGDFVVYPKYGVGKVVDSEERPVYGRMQRCLKINFPADNRTVFINEQDFQRVHLRQVMGSKALTDVYKVLKAPSRYGRLRPARTRTDNYRSKASIADPVSLAEVARDLTRRGRTHRLNETERELADVAVDLLTEEIAFVEKRKPDKVRTKLDRLLGVS